MEEKSVKIRERSETFADHFSQARQFYVSQNSVEQEHICSALVFELSKVKTEAIRSRVMANLRNVDEELAEKVADGLGMELPEKSEPAREPIADLTESKALSILKNPPETFAGRKIGVLVTDGVDQKLFDALEAAAKKEGAMVEVIAPKVGGVKSDSGKLIKADEKLGGGRPFCMIRLPFSFLKTAPTSSSRNRPQWISSRMPSPTTNSSDTARAVKRCWKN